MIFAEEVSERPGRRKSKRRTVLVPRWLPIPDACLYSGLSRSVIYGLTGNGTIRTAHVSFSGRGERHRRLVDRLSLDRFLEGASK
jgi:hypothetical protein